MRGYSLVCFSRRAIYSNTIFFCSSFRFLSVRYLRYVLFSLYLLLMSSVYWYLLIWEKLFVFFLTKSNVWEILILPTVTSHFLITKPLRTKEIFSENQVKNSYIKLLPPLLEVRVIGKDNAFFEFYQRIKSIWIDDTTRFICHPSSLFSGIGRRRRNPHKVNLKQRRLLGSELTLLPALCDESDRKW